MSLLLVIKSVIIFYTKRDPNTDTYFLINTGGILSIISILSAVFSWLMNKRLFSTNYRLIGKRICFSLCLFITIGKGNK